MTSRFLIFAALVGELLLSGPAVQAQVDMSSLRLASNADGRLELLSLGTDGAAYRQTQTTPNGCWGQRSSLQGENLRQIAAATNADGRLELFALGADGRAYHRWQGIAGTSWGAWSTLGGTDLRQVSAATNADGRLELFAVGGDGAVWHKRQTNAGGGWGEWAHLGGTDLRQIAAGANADGRLEVFALGGDGAIWHKWQTTPGGGWGEWAYLQGTDLRQIAVTRNSDGRLELFAIGGDGAAWHNWQASAGGAWSGWRTLQGQNLRQIAAGKNADGRLEILVLGADGRIYEKWQGRAGGGFGDWTGFAVCPQPPKTHAELAAYWAPVIAQDIDADNTRADYITRIDYDGNWSGSDNWENLTKFPLPANVYYWVSETKTHQYIGYAFFHPRDWTSLILSEGPGAGEHENDLEGVLIAIAKDRQWPFGKFLAMVSVAHGYTYSFTDKNTSPSSPWFGIVALSRNLTNGNEDIDGEVDFVVDDSGLHPAVYVEAEGHGAAGSHKAGLVLNVDDYPPMFSTLGITDWRGVAWGGIVAPPLSGNPTKAYSTNGWGDGVIYHYEAAADVPTLGGQTATGGLPRDWQVIGYELLNIRSLWERRDDWKCPKNKTFASLGNFVSDGAQAPWGWPHQFFLHPAHLFETYFDNLGTELWPSGSSYSGNSYDAAAIPCD